MKPQLKNCVDARNNFVSEHENRNLSWEFGSMELLDSDVEEFCDDEDEW